VIIIIIIIAAAAATTTSSSSESSPLAYICQDNKLQILFQRYILFSGVRDIVR
jgi:hypothetical protein